MSILLYGCTTWTLTKRLEKKLNGILHKNAASNIEQFPTRQHPTRHQLYGYQPPITKTIQARRTRHAGHCWRSRDELISDVLLWTPTYARTKARRPARTYIQQPCEDTGCSPEDQPEAMNDREKWWERVRGIRPGGMIWWWWWFGLVWFYSISTIVGYLIPNLFYTYMLSIWFVYRFCKKNIVKRAWAVFCTQLNGFKFCNITITIYHLLFVCTQFVLFDS